MSTPQFIAVQAALALFIFAFSLHLWFKRAAMPSGPVDAEATVLSHTLGFARRSIARVGGLEILVYKSRRLCAVVVLSSLSGVTLYRYGWSRLYLILTEATVR